MRVKLKGVKSITLFCIIGLWYLATPALAQISYSTPASQKAETRKNKKETTTYEADYKESHLNVADFSYKRGVWRRKVVAVDEGPTDYDYDKEINALYESPRKEERKRKKLLKEKKRSKH